MSDTPRTDAILPLGSARDPEIQHVALELAGLSRQLERELRAIDNALRERDKQLIDTLAELSALRASNKELPED